MFTYWIRHAYLNTMEITQGVHFMGFAFWISIIVFALFILATLTAAYNDDKTKGL
ncbi:hypothetical protein J2TS4_35050 [Paenibacillus sp. J2TS4]|nr:hypothetical protein J2TS4_35050 [Paenibacillus sp. J2TS4]